MSSIAINNNRVCYSQILLAALKGKVEYITMSAGFQCGKKDSFSDGLESCVAENTRNFLRTCIKSIHEATERYYYLISAKKSVAGSLSYLLGMSEDNLVEIFKICDFYNSTMTFRMIAFRAWIVDSFDLGTVELTTFSKRNLIKIGISVSYSCFAMRTQHSSSHAMFISGAI